MDRPRSRWVRSALTLSGSTVLAFVALGVPADAATPVTGTLQVGASGLSVRAGATTLAARTGTLRNGTTVTIECQVAGQRIAGRVRTTDLWDRLTDGSYVSDAYVRRSAAPASCSNGSSGSGSSGSGSTGGTTPTGVVNAGSNGLSIRAGATTLAARTGSLGNGTTVTIACQVAGQRIAGRERTTELWNRLTDGSYVSDAYVRRSASPARCASDSPGNGSTVYQPVTGGTPVGTWVTPVPPYRAAQSFRTRARPNHDGEDIMAPRNTPIRATAAGVVVTVTCNTSGPNCDVDGSPALRGCGWYIEIKHAGNIVTRYCHLIRRPSVNVGQSVSAGQTIGYVGSSGSSSGPHLHFEVHTGQPAVRSNAVDPIDFMRRAGAPIG